ncbi:MAG: right-handed parallel beta-helix repeat-containing protein [Deltaproteobacteria bacterium]|nr:right-handed parallel beta-helix repeat-containing protein [Deltaproteobacteria bacterium]
MTSRRSLWMSLSLASMWGCAPSDPEPPPTEVVTLAHRAEGPVICPPPTVRDRAGHCTLTRDEVLSGVLRLSSFTRLDCRGHRLLPLAAGLDGAQAIATPSVPEVAILLRDARGVVIRNCHIGAPDRRFDFGVVIVGEPLPEELELAPGDAARLRNRIVGNTLEVRARGVQTFAAEHNHIAGNTITYSGSRGIGVHLHASDFTRVSDNTITGLDAPISWYHRGVPGVDRQLGCTTCGIATLYPTQAFPLINLIVEGELIQLPNTIGGRSVGNAFVGNDVRAPPASDGGIYVAVRGVGTVVEDNDVSGGAVGIALAGHPIQSFLLLAGTCSGDPTRHCGATTGNGIADHCNVPGVDASPKGTCSVRADCAALGGAPQADGTCRVERVDGRAIDTRVVGNRVGGDATTVTGLSVGNQLHPLVRDNALAAAANGIIVRGRALEQGELTRNTVSAPIGLVLNQADALGFGALVSLNDVLATTALESGACRLGGSRTTCSATSQCDVDRCRVDGRCHLSTATRCTSDAECTNVNDCVLFGYTAELSVGACELDPTIACSTDASCVVGACQGEPERACRSDSECRSGDGRTPGVGLCADKTDRGACEDGRGNHWGRSCEDSEGFRDADELGRCTHDSAVACEDDATCAALASGSACITTTDSPTALVTDGHPFGVGVATTPDEALPATCR